MELQKIISEIKNIGFVEIGTIETAGIPTDPSFRKYCEENLCGQYNASHACPPNCGTPEEMKEKLLSKKNAIVLKSAWEGVDFQNAAEIKAAKKAHNEMEFKLVELMEAEGLKGFMIGSSLCNLCGKCTFKDNKPCIYPDKMFSCVSAYCINVAELAKATGMTYSWESSELNLWGLYIY